MPRLPIPSSDDAARAADAAPAALDVTGYAKRRSHAEFRLYGQVHDWRRYTVVMKPERILKGTFLLAAFASFLLSVILYFQAGDDVNERLNGIFVGIWVPSILALGAFVLAHGRTQQ